LFHGAIIMDSDQPQPATTPEAAVPVAKPADKPVPASKAPAPRPPQERKPPRPDGGGGGGPRKRIRDSVPALDVDFDYKNKVSPNVRDLDKEIAAELEAALQGVDDKNLFGAETSQQVRKEAAAELDHGRKKGKVISVHPPDVFIEIPGGRGQGVLTLEHFPDGVPTIGSEVEVSIEGYDPTDGLLILSRRGAAVHADWSTVAEGMTVEARVIETNKGGLTVDVNGIRGFMPVSQIDRFRVENVEQYVNQKLMCLVTEVDKEAHNLIVSRRAILEKEREEQREKLWAELAEGQVRTGIIGNVRDFGAFVDLGGVDGLLHVSEISWKRIPDATQVLQAGQMIKVVVLKIDRETRKLSLGLKQLEANPWDNIQDRFTSGHTVTGKVTRTMEFGAFVELEPGVEGLIHISELARNKVWRVTDVVKPGQDVEVKVLSVDAEARRISLSLRAALPEEVIRTEEEEETAGTDEPAKPRVRNYTLKGGIGTEIKLTAPEEPQ
jgi:small subunit ribosomal protein S1